MCLDPKPVLYEAKTRFSCLDRKSCASIEDHVDEISYNAAAFYWDSKLNAKVWVLSFRETVELETTKRD